MVAVWLPMLALDARSAWDSHVLDDPRVTEFWDGDRIAGRWFSEQQIEGLGGPGGIVWDAYYAFPRGSAWPDGAASAGSPIIDHVAQLEQDFLPLLRG